MWEEPPKTRNATHTTFELTPDQVKAACAEYMSHWRLPMGGDVTLEVSDGKLTAAKVAYPNGTKRRT